MGYISKNNTSKYKIRSSRLKKIIVSCFLLAGLAYTGLASAEAFKVGVVNIAKVLEQAPQAKTAKKKLEKEFAPRDRELVALQKEVRTIEDKVERDGAIMSDEEKTKLSVDHRARKRELKRLQDEFREDLNLRQNQELGKIQRNVLQAIQALAKSEKYDLIISEGVVFASKRVNITEKVVKKLKAAK